jgi:hypothetical protein
MCSFLGAADGAARIQQIIMRACIQSFAIAKGAAELRLRNKQSGIIAPSQAYVFLRMFRLKEEVKPIDASKIGHPV